jgi:hypothetical protein
VEFLDRNGRLLTASDYGDRDKYLSLVRDIKQTPLSLHWENLLKPMVPAYLGGGMVQYYQIENKRIPTMSYLAFDEPRKLSWRHGAHRVRGEVGPFRYAAVRREVPLRFRDEVLLRPFLGRDDPERHEHALHLYGPQFAMITKHGDACRDLVQNFRHQFFQISVLTNFHKAALLDLSNRFRSRWSACAWAITTACASSR